MDNHTPEGSTHEEEQEKVMENPYDVDDELDEPGPEPRQWKDLTYAVGDLIVARKRKVQNYLGFSLDLLRWSRNGNKYPRLLEALETYRKWTDIYVGLLLDEARRAIEKCEWGSYEQGLHYDVTSKDLWEIFKTYVAMQVDSPTVTPKIRRIIGLGKRKGIRYEKVTELGGYSTKEIYTLLVQLIEVGAAAILKMPKPEFKE